jgi:hypothetical protein
MAGHNVRPLSFPELLKPVLTVPEGDDTSLDRAINAVAERLADSGALIVDASGELAQGVTDEDAVVGLIDTYSRMLMHTGRVDEAADLTGLIDRIQHIGILRRLRGFRAV